jgi:hypothetical protein
MVSFNQWLSLQRHSANLDLASLAVRWPTTRGRLTKESVERRAGDLGLPGVGYVAYAAYLQATSQPTTEQGTPVT